MDRQERCDASSSRGDSYVEAKSVTREMMANTSKLRGETVYIENNLSWEERRIQERINRWVRVEREKGRNVKTEFARVKVDRQWIKWEDINKTQERGERVVVETSVRDKEVRGEKEKRNFGK